MNTRVLIYLDNCIVSDIANRRQSARATASRALWRRITRKGSPFKAATSDYIKQEARGGSVPRLMDERMRLVKRTLILPANDTVADLGRRLRVAMGWDTRMHLDALHVACASFYQVPYLVTGDKELLSRAEPSVVTWLRKWGCYIPLILAPEGFNRSTNPAQGLLSSESMRESRAYRDRMGRAANGNYSRLMGLMHQEAVNTLEQQGLSLSLLDQEHTVEEKALLRQALARSKRRPRTLSARTLSYYATMVPAKFSKSERALYRRVKAERRERRRREAQEAKKAKK